MDVSLVAREDESARQSYHSRHSHGHSHHHHLTPPSGYHLPGPSASTTSGSVWLPHQHTEPVFATPASVAEPVQHFAGESGTPISPSSTQDTGARAKTSIFATQAGKRAASSSSSSSTGAGQDLTLGLSHEDAAELETLQEKYFQAFSSATMPFSDAGIQCEELRRVYTYFVERRTSFLVATPYYHTLAPADRARQLHIAVAMSTYFTGAHLIDTSSFTWRKHRATDESPPPPVVLTAATVRQLLSHQQFTHMMRFYTRFASVLADQTVSIIMQVLALFHPEPGVVAPDAVEVGRRHYGALLARYLTTSLGPTRAAGQLAVLLACQHEARQLVGLLDSLDLTPPQPYPVVSQSSSTLLSNLQEVCRVVSDATRQRVERGATLPGPADSLTQSISLSVEEAGRVLTRLAQCDDPSTLARARAILPSPLLTRLLALLQSSTSQSSSPHPHSQSSSSHSQSSTPYPHQHSQSQHTDRSHFKSKSSWSWGMSPHSSQRHPGTLSMQPLPAHASSRQPSPSHSSPRQLSPPCVSPFQPSPPCSSPLQPSSAQPSSRQPSPPSVACLQLSPRRVSLLQPSPLRVSPLQPSSAHSSPRQLSPPSASPRQPSSAHSSPRQVSPPCVSPFQPSPTIPTDPHSTPPTHPTFTQTSPRLHQFSTPGPTPSSASVPSTRIFIPPVTSHPS